MITVELAAGRYAIRDNHYPSFPMPRSLRIAVVGPSPCGRCYAACCKQNGHEYAVLLEGDELRKFAPFCTRMVFESGGQRCVESVLPYRDGRCIFLGEDDRCTIYDDRPANCRRFECAPRLSAQGEMDIFLQRNPRVLKLLQTM